MYVLVATASRDSVSPMIVVLLETRSTTLRRDRTPVHQASKFVARQLVHETDREGNWLKTKSLRFANLDSPIPTRQFPRATMKLLEWPPYLRSTRSNRSATNNKQVAAEFEHGEKSRLRDKIDAASPVDFVIPRDSFASRRKSDSRQSKYAEEVELVRLS